MGVLHFWDFRACYATTTASCSMEKQYEYCSLGMLLAVLVAVYMAGLARPTILHLCEAPADRGPVYTDQQKTVVRKLLTLMRTFGFCQGHPAAIDQQPSDGPTETCVPHMLSDGFILRSSICAHVSLFGGDNRGESESLRAREAIALPSINASCENHAA